MKKVTAILLGAGGRGNVYSRYSKEAPQEFEVVAVAEPDKLRREQFCAEFGIPAENAVEHWEDLLARPRMADAAMVCTMDDMHTEPAVQALKAGYHVLLEKPMANTAEECKQIADAAAGGGKVLSVCHVLRYTPFYGTIKKLLDDGVLGKVLVIQQTEGVGYWHQAHSFVRGNWGNSNTTSPMILQKCCHDLDILSWLLGARCTSLSSFGSLTHFTAENAPQGAPAYCLDGCPAKDNCLYFAPRFYLEHPRAKTDGFTAAVTTDETREGILEALKKGPYGRCVYHCDNNVVDHQVVNAEFENSAVINLVMTAFTQDCNRTITVKGTLGELYGDVDKDEISYRIFGSSAPVKVEIKQPDNKNNFHHNGGDYFLIRDFVNAVQKDDDSLNRSTAAQSLQSHLMCFAAEESRLTGRTIKF